MADSEFVSYVVESLQPLGPVGARRMFGGHGIYLDGVMFALIADDQLYLKVDGGNRAAYEAAGLAALHLQRQGQADRARRIARRRARASTTPRCSAPGRARRSPRRAACTSRSVRAADSARASAYIPVEDEREGAMGEQDQVLEQVAAWQGAGHKAALATVVSTWGSSPRPVGSQLGVSEQGEMVGSVSGGCIEGAVVKEALEVMAGRTAQAARLRRLQRAGLGGRARLRRQARGLYRGGEPEREPRGEACAAGAPARGPRRQAAGGASALAGAAATRRWWSRGEVALGEPLPAAVLDRSGRRIGATKARRFRRMNGPTLHPDLQPAAAPDRGRRGAHRADAGADGEPRRLRRHRGRSRAARSRATRAFPASTCAPTGPTRRWRS